MRLRKIFPAVAKAILPLLVLSSVSKEAFATPTTILNLNDANDIGGNPLAPVAWDPYNNQLILTTSVNTVNGVGGNGAASTVNPGSGFANSIINLTNSGSSQTGTFVYGSPAVGSDGTVYIVTSRSASPTQGVGRLIILTPVTLTSQGYNTPTEFSFTTSNTSTGVGSNPYGAPQVVTANSADTIYMTTSARGPSTPGQEPTGGGTVTSYSAATGFKVAGYFTGANGSHPLVGLTTYSSTSNLLLGATSNTDGPVNLFLFDPSKSSSSSISSLYTFSDPNLNVISGFANTPAGDHYFVAAVTNNGSTTAYLEKLAAGGTVPSSVGTITDIPSDIFPHIGTPISDKLGRIEFTIGQTLYTLELNGQITPVALPGNSVGLTLIDDGINPIMVIDTENTGGAFGNGALLNDTSLSDFGGPASSIPEPNTTGFLCLAFALGLAAHRPKRREITLELPLKSSAPTEPPQSFKMAA